MLKKIKIGFLSPIQYRNHKINAQISPQLPLGWLLIQIQALPVQWWLKYPQRLHSPHLATAQFQFPQALTIP